MSASLRVSKPNKTPLDRILQRWRIAKAQPYIPRGGRVLDVGCGDGALFRVLGDRAFGVGIDPNTTPARLNAQCELVRGSFPHEVPSGLFDAVVALAVLEHVPMDEQSAFASACAASVRPGGMLIITVPSPVVDRMLHVLEALHLVEFGEVHQHYGYEPHRTIPTFEAVGFDAVVARRFQLGANNLFVFRLPRKVAKSAVSSVGHPMTTAATISQ